ncbi:MAG: tripartite tricarboxylate transporter substrate-binding protein, partial [Alcaligenaceae bacterium]
IIAKLNQAINRLLETEDVKQRFAGMGVEPIGGTPETFARHIQSESDKWGKLIKSANIATN